MAIIQISRITQRKGLQEDLPQPLASAELGWSIDQRRLFIGNGSLEEGAPVVGNTEILTEFSDILSFNTTYTFQGQSAGYTAQTGPTPGVPITQSVQQRLDSYVIVTDFGATGDGVTDDTEAINRAIQQIYCVQVNPQIRRGIYFPAGVYKISGTISIPPYARLYGDGINSSIIEFSVETWVANTAYPANILVKSIEGGGAINYYRSLGQVPAQISGSPVPLSNTTYWQSTDLPTWTFVTADSLLQTGPSIGLNGGTPPQSIEITGMALVTTESVDDSSLGHSLFLLDRVNQMTFNQVRFRGPLTTADINSSAEQLSLFGVDSTMSLPVAGVTMDQCEFGGGTWAFNTNERTRGVTITNSTFDTLYQGIVLGDASPVNGGPSGFRIMHNTFDNVYAEGVVIDSVSLNATGYNTFYDVGNHFDGPTMPATAVIRINADNNISVGDMFERTSAYATTYPRIQLWNSSTNRIPTAVAFTGSNTLQMGSYQRQTGQQATILDGATNQALFTIDSSQLVSAGGFTSFRMEYTLYRNTAATRGVRTGTLTVCGSPGADSAGEVVVYTDDFIENENCDFVLTASENVSDVITVQYSAVATGFGGVIYYSISSLG